MSIPQKYKRLVPLTAQLFLLSFVLFGQSKQDYIKTDSTYRQGYVILRGQSEVGFQDSRGVPPVFFSATEVKEYRYKGDVYQSLFMDGSYKFFLLQVNGENSLFKDRNYYVLRKQDSLLKFNRKDFRAVLKKSVEFEGRERSLSRLLYTRASLWRFVDQCNNGLGNSDKLNYKKYGITVAYGQLKFISELGNEAQTPNQVDQNIVTIGVFGDFPLHINHNLYFSAELLFVKAKPSFYNATSNSVYYSRLDLNGVMIPIGLKWISENGKRIRPFAKAGGLVTIFSVESPTGLLNSKAIDNSTIELLKENITYKFRPFYGFSVDAGIEINNGKRRNIHLGLRYEQTFFKAQFSNTMFVGYSGLSVKLGYTI